MPYLHVLEKSHQCSGSYLRNQRQNKHQYAYSSNLSYLRLHSTNHCNICVNFNHNHLIGRISPCPVPYLLKRVIRSLLKRVINVQRGYLRSQRQQLTTNCQLSTVSTVLQHLTHHSRAAPGHPHPHSRPQPRTSLRTTHRTQFVALCECESLLLLHCGHKISKIPVQFGFVRCRRLQLCREISRQIGRAVDRWQVDVVHILEKRCA